MLGRMARMTINQRDGTRSSWVCTGHCFIRQNVISQKAEWQMRPDEVWGHSRTVAVACQLSTAIDQALRG